MSSRYHRPYWQLAQRIHAQLTSIRGPSLSLALPEESWAACLKSLRKFRRAGLLRWPAALDVHRQQLASDLEGLKYDLGVLTGHLIEPANPNVFAAAEIYRDLVGLEHEFGEVTFDADEDRLSVTTASVVLEEYFFGPFRIELNCQALRNAMPFRVIALEPNPAGTKSDVTHPHVSGEMLCLGDGRQAVTEALASGRLLDFFTIVNRLLHTYSRGHAYVELNDWQGMPCIDCGSTADEEDRYGCDRCEETVCSDCFNRCDACDRILCGGCTSSCRHCEEASCHRCLTECARCGAKLCSACFETPETCQKCHEESQSEAEDSPLELDPAGIGSSDSAETKIPAAVPANSMGQAAVFS